jgi:hypothetical protein
MTQTAFSASYKFPAPLGADDQQLVHLWKAASQFRAAIERCDRKRLTTCMESFPRGSCGDATMLLGTYFIEKGLGTFDHALGYLQNGSPQGRQSHAWLEADDVIVDITADQFPEIDQNVIVSRNSDWHAALERDDMRQQLAADYRIWHPRMDLEQVYKIILAEVERS